MVIVNVNKPVHVHRRCLVCSHVQSKEEAIPPEGSLGTTDELQSRVGELEAKVKDLEWKVTNLFVDNMALTTKLTASQEVERHQQEEITSLKEQLALRAQVHMHFLSMPKLFGCLLSPFPCVQQDTATQEQLLSKTRESQLEDKIKMLDDTRSNLESEVEQLEKEVKRLEILPSYIEQLTKVHIRIT